MQKVVLGRTGLKVSVAGLGAGGASRLGLRVGRDKMSARRIIDTALEGGVNLIDTAQMYRTEEVVGEAIKGKRDSIILSTKTHPLQDGRPISPDALRQSVEQSLASLKTDWIDIFFMHGIAPEYYAPLRDALMPTLLALKEEGKIRFTAISEFFDVDLTHQMLEAALRDDLWDVVMVGFNLLNPSARKVVFPLTLQKKVGTLIMFAVRRALSDPHRLRDIARHFVDRGEMKEGAVNSESPLDFLLQDAKSIPEAAYRFCRHEKGVDVVLTGTGHAEHLKDNLRAIEAPPLSKATLERLHELFGESHSVTGG